MNIPNYIRQQDNHSCVPVSIINAVKWAVGDRWEDKVLLCQLKLVCNTSTKAVRIGGATRQVGTSHAGLVSGIRSRPEIQLVSEQVQPSIKDIKYHLNQGHGVILCYKNWKTRSTGHACFIDKKMGNRYRMINGGSLYADETFRWQDNVFLRKLLARKSGTYVARAYYITKGQ